MAGFFKTSFAVAAGILMSVVALVVLAAGSMLVYQGCINVPDYYLAADQDHPSIEATDADTQESVLLEPMAGVNFEADADGDAVIIRHHEGDLRDRRFRVSKRNLRPYSTGKHLSP